jgi:hypothetical protein
MLRFKNDLNFKSKDMVLSILIPSTQSTHFNMDWKVCLVFYSKWLDCCNNFSVVFFLRKTEWIFIIKIILGLQFNTIQFLKLKLDVKTLFQYSIVFSTFTPGTKIWGKWLAKLSLEAFWKEHEDTYDVKVCSYLPHLLAKFKEFPTEVIAKYRYSAMIYPLTALLVD